MLSVASKWTVTKLENGNYTLILEQTGPRWLSQAGEEEVFVSLRPIPGEWTIRKQEQEGDVYSSVPILMSFIDSMPWLTFGLKYTRIEVPGLMWPVRTWDLRDTNPGTPVCRVTVIDEVKLRLIPTTPAGHTPAP